MVIAQRAPGGDPSDERCFVAGCLGMSGVLLTVKGMSRCLRSVYTSTLIFPSLALSTDRGSSPIRATDIPADRLNGDTLRSGEWVIDRWFSSMCTIYRLVWSDRSRGVFDVEAWVDSLGL